MLFMALAISMSVYATQTTFYYITKSESAIQPSATVYFSEDRGAETDPAKGEITWNKDDIVSGTIPVYYLNVITRKDPTITLTFSPFSGGGTSFGYGIEIKNITEEDSNEPTTKGAVKAGETPSTIKLPDIGANNGERQEFSIQYTFDTGFLDSLGEGSYSSDVTVEVATL